jgi:hypothetical protein
MKISKLLATGACAALAFTINITIVTAHEGEDHAHGVTVPETPEAILTQIHEHHMKIANLVKAKNLDAVHDHSDAIVTLAKALPDKVPADKKAAVTGPANNIGRASAALHEATDAKDQAGAEAKFKNLESAIAQLEKKMK